MQVISAATATPRLKTEYTGGDGWGEYRHNKVFDSAWSLAERVPTTKLWAMVLVHLLETVAPKASSIKDPMTVIDRWRVEGENERQDGTDLFPNPFSHIRFILTQLFSEAALRQFKAHEDTAIRCGLYRRCVMNSQEMQGAFTATPQLFLDHATDNETIWRNSETRTLLRELCWAEKKMDMWYPNIYRGREEYFRKEHPDWFVEVARTPKEEEVSFKEIAHLVEEVQSRQRELLGVIVIVIVGIVVILLVLLKR
jgi:hypothetical protein